MSRFVQPRTIVRTLLALLLLGFLAWFGIIMYNGLGQLLSDSTPFEYEHNLPRGYISRTQRHLATLQLALLEYAQSHKGYLPPMKNSAATLNALRPRLQSEARWCYYNPATEVPFTPNTALSGRKIGALGKNALAFYDAKPPAGYPESYYVTVTGTVGHVPLTQLSALLSLKPVRVNHLRVNH